MASASSASPAPAAQEALVALTARYGQSDLDNAQIIVALGGDGFMLEIKDDGRGFDKEQVLASSKGSGLNNLQKRAKLAGVSLDITAATGKGSIFTFSES